MLKLLHCSDLHLGSSLNHGRINPLTGLNTRLEDFLKSFETCVDRALREPADLFLFGGDAFPDATPPPYIQDCFAQQLRRLVDAHMPVVLLVGNHDQHRQGEGGASLSLYRTLGIPNVVVGDRLGTSRIETAAGPVQIVTLPWLTHSTLMTRPEMADSSLSEVKQALLQRLGLALEAEIRQLDPALPHILLGHAMIDTAQYGAERFLAVGKGFNVPLSLVARPCFDYVALGHVHRHQILCTDPPVAYSGSPERVDFSEEGEEKGYIWVEIDRPHTRLIFVPLPARRFLTLSIDVSGSETPQADLLQRIATAPIPDAIVRLRYKFHPSQVGLIDESALHGALAPAHSYQIQSELVSQLVPPRLPQLVEGTPLSPLEALALYLDWAGPAQNSTEHSTTENSTLNNDRQSNQPNRPSDFQTWRSDLLAAAESLLEEEWSPDPNPKPLPRTHEGKIPYHLEQDDRQLKLF